MAQSIRDVMTPDPITVDASSTAAEAAEAMRDADVGAVIVLDSGTVCGIVTDRDITIRAVADGKDPTSVKVAEICSRDLTTLSPDDSVDEAVKLVRDKAIRRIPVVQGGNPVGIVALGDLATERDPKSALADISTAPPNK